MLYDIIGADVTVTKIVSSPQLAETLFSVKYNESKQLQILTKEIHKLIILYELENNTSYQFSEHLQLC